MIHILLEVFLDLHSQRNFLPMLFFVVICIRIMAMPGQSISLGLNQVFGLSAYTAFMIHSREQ